MKYLTWLVLVLSAAMYVFNVLAWQTVGDWQNAIQAIFLGVTWVLLYTMYRRAGATS